MPKENKSTSRRNRRQCSEVDKETVVASVRDLSETSSNRYNPFPREILKKKSKTEQGSMMMPSIDVLHSMSGGIIESGIKYILFPLHLLRFCIFGTSVKSIASEKPESSTSKRDGAEKGEKKAKERQDERKTSKEAVKVKSSDKSERSKSDRDIVDVSKDVSTVKHSKEKKNSEKDKSIDEVLIAEEDFDSSDDQWSSASNIMPMNMSLDYDNLDRTLSYTMSGEPMDISMEEQPFDKTNIPLNLSQDYQVTEQFENRQKNLPSKLNVDEQDSNSSVDEEIARIFWKQCTSSEDEYSSSFVKSPFVKRERTRQNNFLRYKTNCDTWTVSVHSKKESQGNAKEQKKKQPSDFSINSKRRKVTHEEDKNGKNERRTGSKIREEKRSSRHDAASKHESRASRTPVKNKETKRKDVKYKETATQTDSAFSDDDVEMIPVDAKLCNKRTNRRLHFNLFEGKHMERELNYVADTEDSNDGLSKIERKRISSCSTSSSSTDLGFDERALTTPDMDIVIGRSRTNSLDNTHHFRARSRPPPGFPELPQNPPLTPYIGNSSKHFIATHPNNNCPNCSIVPPAPSPMRHLYYDYPEFMDLPANVNSSRILNNILRNYYR